MPYSGSHRALDFLISLCSQYTRARIYSHSPFSPFEEVNSGLPVKTHKSYTSNHPQNGHKDRKGIVSNKVITSSLSGWIIYLFILSFLFFIDGCLNLFDGITNVYW